jgi:hypothetical protein
LIGHRTPALRSESSPQSAVYANDYDHVVLRREQTWDEDDDSVILIAKTNVLTIVGAILQAAGMDDVRFYRQHGVSCEDVDLPVKSASSVAAPIPLAKPKDSNAAERQRRHRANKSKLDHDSVTVTDAERDKELQLRLVTNQGENHSPLPSPAHAVA